MVAEPRSRLFTVADYDALPDDGPRFELINGALIEMPGVSAFHQLVLLAFVRFLDRFVYDRDLGTIFVAPFDVELMSRSVVQPDVLFVLAERRSIISDRRAIEAPDLVVEVSSPSTAAHDLGDKRALYQAAGVREYWLIDVEGRTATVWALIDGRYEERPVTADGHHTSAVLSGFTVDIGRVFADADRQR